MVESCADGEGTSDTGTGYEADGRVVAIGVSGGEVGAFEAEGDVDGVASVRIYWCFFGVVVMCLAFCVGEACQLGGPLNAGPYAFWLSTEETAALEW